MRVEIRGSARGRRVRLEVSGDTLIWRAAENVATTIYEVKRAVWREHRISFVAIAIATLSFAWGQSATPLPAACGVAVASVVGVYRFWRPQRTIALVLADRVLRMEVDAASCGDARDLVARIERAEPPAAPAALP
jgi:hypothetical protein